MNATIEYKVLKVFDNNVLKSAPIPQRWYLQELSRFLNKKEIDDVLRGLIDRGLLELRDNNMAKLKPEGKRYFDETYLKEQAYDIVDDILNKLAKESGKGSINTSHRNHRIQQLTQDILEENKLIKYALPDKKELSMVEILATGYEVIEAGGIANYLNIKKEKKAISLQMNNHIKKRIFISHSSKDELLVNKFMDHILVLGLGLKRDEDFFCTSDRGASIRSGLDFKKIILEELKGASAVIQIITENYKNSEVCLNEMGAAWVTASIVVPLVAAPFNYDVGFIHASSIQLKLNLKDDLIKFYEDYKKELFINDVNLNTFIRQIEIFVEFVNQYEPSYEKEKKNIFFYEEKSSLVGVLKSAIFGRPWGNKWEDCTDFHRYFFLELNPPIDVLTSNMNIEEGEHNISHFNITKIHLYPELHNKIELKDYENKKVVVTGKFSGAFTGWHRTEVLMCFTNIGVI